MLGCRWCTAPHEVGLARSQWVGGGAGRLGRNAPLSECAIGKIGARASQFRTYKPLGEEVRISRAGAQPRVPRGMKFAWGG